MTPGISNEADDGARYAEFAKDVEAAYEDCREHGGASWHELPRKERARLIGVYRRALATRPQPPAGEGVTLPREDVKAARAVIEHYGQLIYGRNSVEWKPATARLEAALTAPATIASTVVAEPVAMALAVPVLNELVIAAGVVWGKLQGDVALVTILDQTRLHDALKGLEPFLPLDKLTSPTRRDTLPAKFNKGHRVEKISGSSWHGTICGTYSTALTPEGYCVESERETNSVQNYPAAALERVP